jgi:hydroxypyruvate isomerase
LGSKAQVGHQRAVQISLGHACGRLARQAVELAHAQRMEGELAATMQKHLHRIGHIQLADNPGRNEPGTGEINYPFLMGHLDRMGYSGWVGCEYKPAAATEVGLGWRQRMGH